MLGLLIVIFDLGRKQGRFRRSIEGAAEEQKEQQSLQHTECELDWVVLWRIRREVSDQQACNFDDLSHLRIDVNIHVV